MHITKSASTLGQPGATITPTVGSAEIAEATKRVFSWLMTPSPKPLSVPSKLIHRFQRSSPVRRSVRQRGRQRRAVRSATSSASASGDGDSDGPKKTEAQHFTALGYPGVNEEAGTTSTVQAPIVSPGALAFFVRYGGQA